MKIINDDCIAAMKEMPENSIDSIVTDPPYELGFMGKSWDSTGIAFNVEVWQEALRVLKPGGHLIAFSGSRTYHRMAVAIEDAGFEIRDQIMWVYGSGFPKSHDVSKAIDKTNGEPNRLLKFTTWMRTTGLKAKQLDEITETNMGGHYLTDASQPAIPTVALWAKIRPLIAEIPQWVDELVDRIEAEREVVGTKPSSLGGTVAAGERNQDLIDYHKTKIVDITAPSTPEAQQWQGWGTALKPAHEPMVLARKPLIGTVANNVLTYGVGGLNIDGSRIPSGDTLARPFNEANNEVFGEYKSFGNPNEPAGRWPANFIHDGSDEVLELFPDSKGGTYPAIRGTSNIGAFADGGTHKDKPNQARTMGDDGSAARFFYCAKTSKRDRNEGLDDVESKSIGAKGNGLARICSQCNTPQLQKCGCEDATFINPMRANHHPTVKPTDLMRYLVKLVTPPNGTVLDPFMGSGSTGKGAVIEGFDFIGIEMNAEYIEIARARIEFAMKEKEGELDFDPK